MGVTRIGDWDRVEGLIGNIGREMIEARDISLKRWGLKAEQIAVRHISKQDLAWKELKPATLAEKIRKGFSENILVRTSTYFQSITSWAIGNSVYAGIHQKAVSKDGEVLADIAATHEYGSRSGNIPARPLWKPTFDETMQWYMSGENQPQAIFLKNIRRRYGV